MSSPLGKPRTLRQWLLGSACWFGSCVGGWLVLAAASSAFIPRNYHWSTGQQMLAAGGVVLGHGLIWQKVVFSWQPAQDTDAASLFLVAGTWLLAAVVFQLVCLAYLLIGLAFASDGSFSWG